ncbi:MAG TPA: hypothetical protein VGH23_01920 [Rhizomicrobium sp.]
MPALTQRRELFSGAALLGAAMMASAPAMAEPAADLVPNGASSLADLTARLARAPRRRDFKTVPMILNDRSQWDSEALDEVLAYKPATKQAWDVTDIGGPWLNAMRNSLNVQIWSFGHKDFLVVCETHGTAQLALYDQAMWDKYGLAKLAGSGFARNTLIEEKTVAASDPADYENPTGIFSAMNNSIPALQRRGVVFMSCHNAIWEQATKLAATGPNLGGTDVATIAADLTNHLIPGVVLTPGAVATLPELQRKGFAYAR